VYVCAFHHHHHHHHRHHALCAVFCVSVSLYRPPTPNCPGLATLRVLLFDDAGNRHHAAPLERAPHSVLYDEWVVGVRMHVFDVNLTCQSPASSFYGSPRLAPHAHTMTTARMHVCMHCFAIDHDAPPPLPCKHHALLTTFATTTALAIPLRLMAATLAFRSHFCCACMHVQR
jgi:hypothetical protein